MVNRKQTATKTTSKISTTQEPKPSIVEFLESQKSVSKFWANIKEQKDLYDLISDAEKTWTIFAPNDDAYSDAQSVGIYTVILLNGTYSPQQLEGLDDTKLVTATGMEVFIRVNDDGNIFINNARIAIDSVEEKNNRRKLSLVHQRASNGVVYRLDTVYGCVADYEPYLEDTNDCNETYEQNNGDTCLFRCAQGYEIEGNATLTCNISQGKWVGLEMPTCSKTSEVECTFSKELPGNTIHFTDSHCFPRTFVIIVGVAAGVVLILFFICIFCCCRVLKRKKEERDAANNQAVKTVAEVHHYYHSDQKASQANAQTATVLIAHADGECLQHPPSQPAGVVIAPSAENPTDDLLNDYDAERRQTSSLPPVPIQSRTFAMSNFNSIYSKAQKLKFAHELLSNVQELIDVWAKRQDFDKAEAADFFQKLYGQAFKNTKELEKDLPSAAEFLWTSGKQLRGYEFCTIINDVIRMDLANELQLAIPIIRLINQRRVTNRDAPDTLDVQQYPNGGTCWRGGGFVNEHKGFFTKGKVYRIPGFLATSGSESVATSFVCKVSDGKPRIKWKILLDKRGKTQAKYRVSHMTYVNKTLIPGEGEYLFAPYSVFTVKNVSWSSSVDEPHNLTIQAAYDNLASEDGKKSSEDLPLAPWY